MLIGAVQQAWAIRRLRSITARLDEASLCGAEEPYHSDVSFLVELAIELLEELQFHRDDLPFEELRQVLERDDPSEQRYTTDV